MYTDKDKNGHISVMDLTNAEAKDLASLLFESEHLIVNYSSLPEREKAALSLFSARLRFKIIDSLK
jgi:hypothetical protein